MAKREKLKKLLEAWKSDLQKMKILTSPVYYLFSFRNGIREAFLLPPIWEGEGDDLSFRVGRDLLRTIIKVDACEIIGAMTKTIPATNNQCPPTKIIYIASDSIKNGLISVSSPYHVKKDGTVTFGKEIWESHSGKNSGSFFSSSFNAMVGH